MNALTEAAPLSASVDHGEIRAGFRVRSVPVRPETLDVEPLESPVHPRFRVKVSARTSCSHRDLIDWSLGSTHHYGGKVSGPVPAENGRVLYEVTAFPA